MEKEILNIFTRKDEIFADLGFTPLHVAVRSTYDPEDRERPSLEKEVFWSSPKHCFTTTYTRTAYSKFSTSATTLQQRRSSNDELARHESKIQEPIAFI